MEDQQQIEKAWCAEGMHGTEHFAFELWVHSHPALQPCDVDASSNYTWNYDNVPDTNFVLELQPALRFRPYTI